MTILPEGWVWYELEGRRIFDEYDMAGVPTGRIICVIYDPTDRITLETGDFKAAQERGTAKIIVG